MTKVKELSEWKSEEVEIEFKEDNKREKNQKANPQKTPKNPNITFRSDRPPAPETGYKPASSISILFGTIGAK